MSWTPYTSSRDNRAGRCGAETATIDGGRREARNLSFLVEGTGMVVKPNAKDIARVRKDLAEMGISWDGFVTDSEGRRYYIDEETVRGNYPADCPRWLRRRIGEVVAAEYKDGGDPTGVRVFLALQARENGYKATTSSLTASLRKNTTWTTGLRGGSVYRALDELDGDALERLVVGSGLDVADLEAIRMARAAGVPLIGLFQKNGRITGLAGVVPTSYGGKKIKVGDGCDVDELKMNFGIGNYIRNKERNTKIEGALRCHRCRVSHALCSCKRDHESVAIGLRYANESSGSLGVDHAWGHEHATIPTAAMQERAQREGPWIAQLVSSGPGGSETVELIKQVGGDEVWERIALYFAQIGMPEDDIEKLFADGSGGGNILKLLEKTSTSSYNIHRDYVRMLYAEFDAEDAPLGGGGLSETYLGRDGIFAKYARDIMQQEYERVGDPRAHANNVSYIMVSRYSPWGIKNAALVGEKPVFIDTGFSGSIPKRIAETSYMKLVKNGKPPKAGQGAVRLMHSTVKGFGFLWQTPNRDPIHDIEHAAKTDLSARYVGDRAPAGALERFIHGQVRYEVEKIARAQMRELLHDERQGDLNLDSYQYGSITKEAKMEAGQSTFWDKLKSAVGV